MNSAFSMNWMPSLPAEDYFAASRFTQAGFLASPL